MIEVRSVLNPDSAYKLTSTLIKRSLKFMIPLGLVFVALGVVFMVVDNFSEDALFGGIALIVLGALLPVIFVVATKVIAKRNIRSNKLISQSVTQNYAFGVDCIIIKETSSSMTSTNEYAYNLILKGFEDDKSIYLYLNNVNALVVSKSDFVSGTPEELRYLLCEKLGERFKPLAGAPMVRYTPFSSAAASGESAAFTEAPASEQVEEKGGEE